MQVLTLCARVCAGAVAALGITVLAGWAWDIAALKSVLPGHATMKANTALCFVLAGAALALVSFPSSVIARRIGQGCAGIVLLVALLTLGEQLTAFDLRIDELLVRDPDTPRDLNPGRMAFVTSLGFLMAGLCISLSPLAARSLAPSRLARALAYAVLAIGSISLLSYALDIEFLYASDAFGSVAVHTAAGFLVLGAGLLAVAQAGTGTRLSEEARITRLAALLLVLAAGATGIAGFAVLESQVQRTLTEGLRLALATRVTHIKTNVMLRANHAEIITTPPNMLKHLRLRLANPANREFSAVVQGVLESFRPHGFSAITVSSPDGEEIARIGRLADAPALEVKIGALEDTRLLWKDGFYLRQRLALREREELVGTVVAEQFLPNLTEALLGSEAGWDSAELVLCRPEADVIRCFPTRHSAAPLTLPREPSKAPLLVHRALAEGAGFYLGHDYRGRRVLGAAAPVGDLGLLAILKVDAAEIYYPITRQFQIALALVAVLATLGTLLVHYRVRPLARALETRVRDRTADLNAANLRLGESEERLRLLISTTHRAAWDWDIAGQRLWHQEDLSVAAEGVVDPAEAACAAWFERMHPEDRERIAGSLQALLAGDGRLWSEEYQYRNPDGSYAFVLELGVIVRDSEGRPLRMAGAMLDITARKEAEEEIRRLNEHLEQRVLGRTAELTAANQELEAFSYSVSHDLRAPLRHIDGFTGLLAKQLDPSLDATGRRYLTKISNSAREMGKLIDDLLSFSRIGRAELRSTRLDLSGLLQEVLRILEPETVGREISWTIGVLPEAQGDPQLLRLVFQNLVANALKYTRPNRRARIEIGATRDGGEIIFSVRDNGVGFDLRYADRLFGVFQRLHSGAEFEGTGIGLANVKRIVQRHGGRVWAEGSVGEGACFYFSLPDQNLA